MKMSICLQVRGFDEAFIHGGGVNRPILSRLVWRRSRQRLLDPLLLHNGRFVKTEGYCTDLFFDQRRSGWTSNVRPVSGSSPTCPPTRLTPLYRARPDDAALYRGQVDSEQVAHFFGMIHNIDQNVGRLLAALEQWGIQQDTLVVFMNDNGTAAGQSDLQRGMRGAKGSAWLGGRGRPPLALAGRAGRRIAPP